MKAGHLILSFCALALPALSLAEDTAPATCLNLQTLEEGMRDRHDLRRTYLSEIRITGGEAPSLPYRQAMLRLNFYAGTGPVEDQLRYAHFEQTGCSTVRAVQNRVSATGTELTEVEEFRITASSATRLELRKVTRAGAAPDRESSQIFELQTLADGSQRIVKTIRYAGVPYDLYCPDGIRHETHDVEVVTVTEWGRTLSPTLAFQADIVEFLSNGMLRPELGLDPRPLEVAQACVMPASGRRAVTVPDAGTTRTAGTDGAVRRGR